MKKRLPRTLTEVLEKVLVKDKHLLNFGSSIRYLLKITEKNDPDSPFYFGILYRQDRPMNVEPIYEEDYRAQEANADDRANNREYTCEYLPSNLENTSSAYINVSLDEIPEHLKTWIGFLKEYNKESILFDDPIVNKYYNDLEGLFNLTDEDADYAPHSFVEQEALSEYYDRAKILIEAADINQSEREELQAEIIEAEQNISRSTKTANISAIRKLLARALKFKRELGKELLIELCKEGLKWLVTNGPQMLPS